ncbi:MAG: DsbA family protein, partial [Ginsengibacter sp.]
LIQFAKSDGVAAEAFESLFKNYFSEGKNIDDLETLLAIGISLGMNKKKLKDALESDAFSREVRQDETKAKNLKITEAPFFIINKKQAIHGEQSPQIFLDALNASWKDFKKQKPYILTEGDSYYSTERKN